MVMHWHRHPGPHSRLRMAVNGVGAFATGVTTVVVLVAKFAEGAWITAILIPLLIVLMLAVRHHYARVDRETAVTAPMDLSHRLSPLVVVPVDRWTRISEKALRFALKLSDQVQAVHVDAEDCGDQVCDEWKKNVVSSFNALNETPPDLILVPSPFRLVLMPLVDHILLLEARNPDRQIAVLVPELVVTKWWQYFLHNQRAQLLKLLLLIRGNQRIIVINIPWYL
jgi:hypothetical protein